jgi:hypothetical protein
MLRTALLFVRSAVRLVYAELPGPVAVGRPTARRKGKVHRESQLSARKSISKLLHYSAVRTIQQATGKPAYSIPSYWSSLQGGEWLKRGGQRTPAAPYPVGLIRAGTNRAWICWRGSAARWPAAQAGMLAGAGALSGCSGPGRRICQGKGVSGVAIDRAPPATVLNRSGMPRSVRPRGSGRLFDTLKLWAWQLAPSWLPHCQGRWPDSGKQGRAPSLSGPSVPE